MTSWVVVGVEADEDGVGFKCNCVGYDVAARGDVDGAVFGDGLFEDGGVVGGAVAPWLRGCGRLTQVSCARGRGDIGGDGRRDGAEAGAFDGGFDFGGAGGGGEDEAVGEGVDAVDVAFAGDGGFGVAEESEGGDMGGDDVLEVDLGAGVVLVGDGDGGAGDVFEAGVLDP